MDKLIIDGGNPLSGSVEISGAKNAVLPIMALALLVDGQSKLHQVPDLRDTRTFIKLLNLLGANSEFENHSLTIDASNITSLEAPYDLVKTMRASFYVMGPLLARFGEARVSLPGGCAWGPRPVDYHLKGFKKLGAEVILEDGYITARAKKLVGANIHFEIASVGATANITMAAVLADGTTTINNAAAEPHIVQLCETLNQMGADIDGIGSNTLIINGVNELSPFEISVIPDMIEAGTFLFAGAAMGNNTLTNVDPNHLSIVLDKLSQAGCSLSTTKNSITINKCDLLRPVDVNTDVYPGFAPDLQAQWIALMSISNGASVITDNIYHDRFSHVPELNRLGANITTEKNSAFVKGVKGLKGAQVMSTDISRVYHIDRGYERIEEKFHSLGAKIFRYNK